MATTVLKNDIDRVKWQRPFTKGKFASSSTQISDLGVSVKRRVGLFVQISGLRALYGPSPKRFSILERFIPRVIFMSDRLQWFPSKLKT